jgi:hypothetical protein
LPIIGDCFADSAYAPLSSIAFCSGGERRVPGGLAAAPPKLFVSMVEQFPAARHPRFVQCLRTADARDNMANAGRFGACELAVAEVQIAR